jgi:hypothetical protein
MREDQIVPAVQRDQPVTGGKIDAGLPFGGADLILDAGCRLNGRHAHGYDLWLLVMVEAYPTSMNRKPV